ncbi:MAG TPA: HD domain-containing protein [Pseudomonadales bacterium]|nr:HD domain-containing protein [Pseudomonadales bacterium]
MVTLKRDELRRSDGSFDGTAWIDRLCADDPRLDRALLLRAFEFVVTRGDQPLVAVGVEFADLMAELKMDTASIASGLVYRIVRTRRASASDIERDVDAEVASLVADVDRVGTVSLLELTNPRLLALEARDQVDNVRRMLVAMIDDVRVAIIKLAERIIALRSAKSDGPERQARVAREALEVFAPLANRLGIWRLKWELEDLAFRFEDPDAYRRIAQRLEGKRIDREADVDSIGTIFRRALADEGIEADVRGRAKHIYSIARKMDAKHIDFGQVYDIRALRVVVGTIRDCYAALGVIHTRWRHVPREFDDYVANPKDNGYRSIHTAVVGPDQRTIEVQIRTRDMHREAELGVCAHWSYKHDAGKHDAFYAEKLSWLRQVLEWHEEVGGFVSVGRELRSNIEDGRIYVFTPGGHVLDLPAGSTPIDFAYRVHTQIGSHAVGARVDGMPSALNTPLETGQRVEIVTAPDATPNRDWLDQNLGYVKTARALAKIQSWFRSLDRGHNVAAGRAMIDAEFARLATRTDVAALAASLGYAGIDALCLAVAVGERQLLDVVAAHVQLDGVALGKTIIDLRCEDRAGMLHDITAVLADDDISISSVSIEANSGAATNAATIRLGVEVGDLLELARLLDRMSRISGVAHVRRYAPAALESSDGTATST